MRLCLLASLCLAIPMVACAGAAPTDDGLTTNPDAKHDGNGDGNPSGSDTLGNLEDTFSASDDSSVEDTGAPLDTNVADATDGATLTCAVDEYDVDGDEANGCEYKDSSDDHTVATAFAMGDVDECDSSYTWITHSGVIASDERLHGSTMESGLLGRPQFITARHVAKTFCVDDPVYQITLSGGLGTYRISVFRHGDLAQLDTKCSPHEVAGGETSSDLACTGQDDGELAIIEIEKVSGPREKVSYTLKYHN